MTDKDYLRQEASAGVRWYAGLTVDHLFADCPNRTRAEKSLRECGWWSIGDEGAPIDPHGDGVCGLCVHRFDRARLAGGLVSIAEYRREVSS